MKKLSTAVSIILSATMIITAISSPCWAEEKQDDPYESLKKGIGYIAIGDSITRGFGASDKWHDELYKNGEYGQYNCRNVTGSYPNRVAEALGLNTPNDIRDTGGQLWPITHNALSTAFVLDLLGIDDGYRDTEMLYNVEEFPSLSRRYDVTYGYFGDATSYNPDGVTDSAKKPSVMSIHEMFRNADLFTIQLGLSDVPYRINELILSDMTLDKAAEIPELVPQIVKLLYRNYKYWTRAYPMLLEYVKEVNPDATVVLVGAMNPLANIMLTDDILLPIGNALNVISDKINAFNRKCAKKYGFIYVDVNDIDTPATEIETSIKDLGMMDPDPSALYTHPTPAGYEQISRRIVAAIDKKLDKENAEKSGQQVTTVPVDTTITVDIGRFEKADCVKVNDVKYGGYTVNDHELYIPYGSTNGETLKVYVVKDDGTTTLQKYTLKYSNKSGYTARRIYVTHDLKSTITTTFRAPVSIAKKIINLIKGAL